MSRRKARKQAFLVLYQSDVNEVPVEATFERWRAYRGDLEEYAVRLAGGVEARGMTWTRCSRRSRSAGPCTG